MQINTIYDIIIKHKSKTLRKGVDRMENVNRETLKNLEGLINCEIIRTEPTASGDVSYTNEPTVLVKIKTFIGSKAKLVVASPLDFIDGKHKGKTITLPTEFADDKWTTYHNAKFGGDSPLNKLEGRNIKMVRPTKRGDTTWMCKNKQPPLLIHANEHHITLVIDDKYEIVLGPDFTNPDDWTLAE